MKFLIFFMCLFLSFQSYSQKSTKQSTSKSTATAKSNQTASSYTSANSQSTGYSTSYGQDYSFTVYDIDTTFTFTGENRTAVLEFDFSEESNELSYHASGSIKGGSLKLFLVDPRGKRHPGFTLKAKGNGTAKGVVNEVNDDIIKGTWKIEVKNTKATGEINIKVGQN